MAFCIYLWELQNLTETRGAPKLVETRSACSYNTCVLICLQSPEMMTSEEITAFLSVSGVSHGLPPQEVGDGVLAAQSRRGARDGLICREGSLTAKLLERLPPSPLSPSPLPRPPAPLDIIARRSHTQGFSRPDRGPATDRQRGAAGRSSAQHPAARVLPA